MPPGFSRGHSRWVGKRGCDVGLITRVGKLLLMRRWIQNSTGVATVRVHLYRTAIVPTLSMTLADLTLCNWSGYTFHTSLFNSTPYVEGDGGFVIPYADAVWTFNDPASPQTVYGYAVVLSDGTTLVGVYPLDDPLPLTTDGQVVMVTPKLRWDG